MNVPLVSEIMGMTILTGEPLQNHLVKRNPLYWFTPISYLFGGHLCYYKAVESPFLNVHMKGLCKW